jgi:hypothetical protein
MRTPPQQKVSGDFLQGVENGRMDIDDVNSVHFICQLMAYDLCGNTHRKDCEADFERMRATRDQMTRENKDDIRAWMSALMCLPQIDHENQSRGEPKDTPTGSRAATTSSTHRPETRSMTRNKKRTSMNIKIAAINNNWIPGQPYIPKFVLYHSKLVLDKAVSNNIRTIVYEALTPRQRKPGYIYMYWFPGSFGYIKIGKTEKQPAERMAEWRRKCKHEVESTSEEIFPVQHVYLVEKLLHTELKDMRYH